MENLEIRNFVYICFVLFMVVSFSGMASAEEGDALKGNTVNINTSTLEELSQVPLVTEEMAQGIIDYRDENGDFMIIDELLDVDGFDKKIIKRIEKFLLLKGIGGDACTC